MEGRADRRETILDSATAVTIESNLTDWSIAQVAAQAGVAKGLVIYYFRTRRNLLREVAARLRSRVNGRRLEALSGTGTEALDALWVVLEGEVHCSEAAALLTLTTSKDQEIREAAAPSTGDRVALARAAAHALELPHRAIPPGLLEAVISGLQLQRIAGCREGEIRDTWDQFWLLVVR